MTGPPGAIAPLEPLGQVPSATRREVGVSTYVLVTNPVWNTGSGRIKRKVANFYVAEGRAIWLNDRQIRLVDNHAKNRAAKFKADLASQSFERRMTEPEKQYAANARSAARWGRDRKNPLPNFEHAKRPSPIVRHIHIAVNNLQFMGSAECAKRCNVPSGTHNSEMPDERAGE